MQYVCYCARYLYLLRLQNVCTNCRSVLQTFCRHFADILQTFCRQSADNLSMICRLSADLLQMFHQICSRLKTDLQQTKNRVWKGCGKCEINVSKNTSSPHQHFSLIYCVSFCFITGYICGRSERRVTRSSTTVSLFYLFLTMSLKVLFKAEYQRS